MFLLPNTYWRVQKTKEKGRGIFAKKRILAGTVIGDYLGKIIPIVDYNPDDEKGMYLMAFTDESFIYPDMSKPGIYLLNHSCRPNCWMSVYCGHTLFFALFDIQAGEELTISYLLSPKDMSCAQSCDHVCRCKSTFCTGTMHLPLKAYTLWQAFLKKEKRKTSMAPYRIGASLPPLASYPLVIPSNPIYEAIYTSTG